MARFVEMLFDAYLIFTKKLKRVYENIKYRTSFRQGLEKPD